MHLMHCLTLIGVEFGINEYNLEEQCTEPKIDNCHLKRGKVICL